MTDNDILTRVVKVLREFGSLTSLDKLKDWNDLINNDENSGKVVEKFGEAMRKHSLRFLNYYVADGE